MFLESLAVEYHRTASTALVAKDATGAMLTDKNRQSWFSRQKVSVLADCSMIVEHEGCLRYSISSTELDSASTPCITRHCETDNCIWSFA
jgi:hypothetical protein